MHLFSGTIISLIFRLSSSCHIALFTYSAFAMITIISRWQRAATKNFRHMLLLPVMESRDLVSVSRRASRPGFWSLGLEGFRSRSWALRLETLHRLFFMKFCKKEFLKKTVLKHDCSKFSRSKKSVAKLSFCYVVCEIEKTIFPLPRSTLDRTSQ